MEEAPIQQWTIKRDMDKNYKWGLCTYVSANITIFDNGLLVSHILSKIQPFEY